MPHGKDFPTSSGVSAIPENVAGNLTGILGTRPVGKFLSGARVTLRINGRLVGFAFGIQWKIETQQRENNTVDDYLPAEIAPTRVHVSGSIACLRIPGTGSATRNQFQSNVLSFLAHQYIEIEARDVQTDELLFYTPKAAITSRVENIQSGQLAQMTLEFIAVGWSDELTPAYPKGIDGGEGAKSAIGQAIDSITSGVSDIGSTVADSFSIP